MAISPSVQQHHAQFDQQEAAPTEQTFRKKFGESAYNAFKAKFPSLLQSIVTFKVIDADIDAENGLAVFILAKGDDVVYAPVVLANGMIESCEMVYNKTDDSFLPLTESVVENVVNANQLTDYKLTQGQPSIEDTRDMFKNFTRPPVSSNPVLSGERDGISELPNRTKEKIASYLQDTPELMGRIAEFYPIGNLAEKLASTPEPEHLPDVPTVISLEDVTRDVAEKLASEQKKVLLQDGYLILKEAQETVEVVSTKHLVQDLINSQGLTEISNKHRDEVTPRLQGTGYIFHVGANGIDKVKCLISEDVIITQQGTQVFEGDKSLVVGEFTDGINASDLIEFGGLLPENLVVGADATGSNRFYFFYPTRNKQHKLCSVKEGYDTRPYEDRLEKRTIDSNIYLVNEFTGESRIGFVDYMDYGFLKVNDTYTFPKDNTYTVRAARDPRVFIASISQLYKLVNASASKIKIVNDGAGKTLVDSSAEKAASFQDESALISHLVTQYQFSKKAVDTLFRDKEVLLFNKQAFMQPPVEEQPQTMEMGQGAGMFAAPAAATGPDTNMPAEFEPEILDAAAEIGDPELMETGILASVAGEEDIKLVLVDMIPDFSNTVSKLGRTILMMNLEKEDLVDFYGEEEFQSLLSNIRKVFKTLGELVFDLHRYINMN